MADGIINKDQLLSLTLRQLRQEASKLSVPLYSRKTKAVLVDLILKYQEKSTKKTYTTPLESKSEETYESNAFQSSEEVKTNVVFLPRDPDWAYVFGKFLMQIEKKHNLWEPINYVYDYLMHLVLMEAT